MTDTPKLGRPKLPDDKRRHGQARPLFIKLTPDERGVIDQAAATDDKPPSVWARDILLRAARRRL